jgi:hypothetical protein
MIFVEYQMIERLFLEDSRASVTTKKETIDRSTWSDCVDPVVRYCDNW